MTTVTPSTKASEVLIRTIEAATISKLRAEEAAYSAEAMFNSLQSERLVRARAEEDASVERQRIMDFFTEVNEISAHRAINRLSEWRHKSDSPITIRFNTPGGDFLSAMAFYDYIILLRNEGITVNTVALGMAASAGAALLQAGEQRFITQGAWVMVHEVTAMAVGKLSEMIDETKWASRAQDRLLSIMEERSTLTAKQIKTRINKKEWWLSSDEAIQYGFADRLMETP